MSSNPFRRQPTPAELYTPPTFAEQAQAMLLRSRANYGVGFFMEGEDDPTPEEKAAADAKAAEDKAAADAKAAEDAAASDKVELDKLPKEVQDIVARYRKEAADANGKAREEARTKAAEEARADLIQKIGKELGLVKDDAKLTPEEFEKKLAEASAGTSAAQEDAKNTKIELAVYRTAGKAGGDPEALLDSRSFLEKVAKLDPSAKDFNDKVTTAIKDAVKDNPKLKPRAGAGSSSVDHGSGGSGDQGGRQVKPLNEAVAGHYGT